MRNGDAHCHQMTSGQFRRGILEIKPMFSTREKPMMGRFMIAALTATIVTLSPTAFAQQGQLGTAQEARAMLDKATAAVKADQAVALGMFNKGEGG
jgi:mannose/fructose/N-acetylgalactosamine-specific phosphotransferase system component IID